MARQEPMDISPKEYEQYVKDWFDGLGYKLNSYSSTLNNKVIANDGKYEIDIDITYEALGATFHVLVECKRHSSNIKRELVQVLHQKIKSVGAHKGILCSTSDFQKGALEYARIHGIACMRIVDGRTTVMTRDDNSKGVSQEYCELMGIPKVCGYIKELVGNSIQRSIVDKTHLEYIEKILEP
ncbi:MAG: hypothetical protein DRP45_09555 [Candidatus Zixiibacteriota bacterium]|nr:MAG: hypothetical protein DRP45_09555 [candidate division Zixibacteria bacterium]